jgi:hypothetical protein|tara:strand:- start:6636 stop:7424 length:789 start_codon:yes stop_codon:yes gene_type:complete
MYNVIGKSFETEKEYFDFIVNNEKLIIDTKKSEMKMADGFGFLTTLLKKDFTSKEHNINTNAKEILVKIAINSTNILDSHEDVHIPGIWDKSLKERGSNMLHLQEHIRKFDHVISKGEDLKAYTDTVSWKSLGFDMEGNTEILTFDSLVKESQNKQMFDEYMKGSITEHSVGMQYVKLFVCINHDDYPEQKQNYEKYAPMVANREELERTKMFYAITEAKAIEGSAVLMGSNSFTPTISSTTKETVVEINEEKSAIEKWLKS